MKTIVSLVSDQTIPNIIFIKEMVPYDRLIFISTEKMENQEKTDTILSLVENIISETVVVKEDDINDIKEKLSNIEIEENEEFVVNITGGTKLMSIAVYEFFQNYSSKIYYMTIGKNSYAQIYPKIEEEKNIEIELGIEEYFKSYNVKVEGYGKIVKDKEYTKKFFENYINNKMNESVIDEFRRVRNEHRSRKKTSIDDIAGGEIFLENTEYELKEEGFIFKHDREYLSGNWFEEFVYNLISEYIDSDKIGIGTQISNKNINNELDIVCIIKNSIHVIECKTSIMNGEENILTETVYKIAALRNNFGLMVKSYLFVLDEEIREKDRERAKIMNVTIIDRGILSNKKRFEEEFISKILK
jgi:hypothetical protein